MTLDDDGVLTFVGYVLADLPLTIGLSKMLLYGYAFGALEDCIIIGLRHGEYPGAWGQRSMSHQVDVYT